VPAGCVIAGLFLFLAQLFVAFPAECGGEGTSTPVTAPKRCAPSVIAPIVYKSVEYSVSAEGNRRQFSVYVVATRLTGERRTWKHLLYRIRYKPGLERDVQEVHPVSMKMEGDIIVVTDERSVRHRVSAGFVAKRLGSPRPGGR